MHFQTLLYGPCCFFYIGYLYSFPFSDPVITDKTDMAWHLRRPEEEKQLLESLTEENRIGCFIQKKPDGM